MKLRKGREEEELRELLEKIKVFVKEDFDVEYSFSLIQAALERELQRRLDKFVYARISHLRDFDFANFMLLAEKDSSKKEVAVDAKLKGK